MTTRQRRNTKVNPEPEVVEEEVDPIQWYQDKAHEYIDAAHGAVKATPTEVAANLATAQVYATMANTEALRAR